MVWYRRGPVVPFSANPLGHQDQVSQTPLLSRLYAPSCCGTIAMACRWFGLALTPAICNDLHLLWAYWARFDDCSVESSSCSLHRLPVGQGCNSPWLSTFSCWDNCGTPKGRVFSQSSILGGSTTGNAGILVWGVFPLLLRTGVTLEWHHSARAGCQVWWSRSCFWAVPFQVGLLCGEDLQRNIRLGHGVLAC